MIHVDARTPDQFYDERYDSYICFLTRGSGRSESTQPEVFQPRIGGEGALIGAEGVKSFPMAMNLCLMIILSRVKRIVFCVCVHATI